jgi:hypothetical protein
MRCVRYKKVRMKGNGLVRRCAKYKGGPPRRKGLYAKAGGYRRKKSRSKRGYPRGHRPYNKGKSCVSWGLNKRGVRTCRSYGATYGGKKKNRRKSRPSGVRAPFTSMRPADIWRNIQSRSQAMHNEPRRNIRHDIPGGGYVPSYMAI